MPDAVADRLAAYLHAYTNPRRFDDATGVPVSDGTIGETDPLVGLPYPRRLGKAFCQLLESLDPTRLPVHGGAATTVIVTIPFETLTRDLGVAEVLGGIHLPGAAEGEDGAGGQLSAAQARRLACTANILLAVLGGASEVLDHGRAQRLFTPSQRRALLIRDRVCRAEGCDIPGTWCEAHHWIPWHSHGPTDLTNGVLLCSHHHHHRTHDPTYTADRLPNGDVRYTRRT